MAARAVTFLLENLKQLITCYPELISGSENELEQLMNELSSLKSFLKDASNHDEVKYLRQDKVKPTLDRLANMHISDGSGTSAEEPSLKVKKVPLIREENIVDLGEAEWTLTNYLKEETDELDVISIIGMLGLGKTTMAWNIYQSPIVQHEFPTRVWIHVSQEFNRMDVFLRILKEFTNEDMSSMSDLELAVTVRGYLETGKFLHTWMTCGPLKPGKLSRMPVQGAIISVEVFGKLDDCPIELVEIGRYITKQCDGLQLAVVVIGKVLKRQIVNDENNRCDYKGMDECVRKLEHAY
ncbi:hypothetical protein BUALT_Bualt07G0018500 [Buddleja alternifolia]|uniref:NB-ARC domain-containing protein n=1 Tax=Buddleja alternifolia TaxID=168488 RepID=A0AAV6X8R0_9LAMI|nr:hypothetical protein BUALT_Bualt07G0018500 [Buddleja alternifolia]